MNQTISPSFARHVLLFHLTLAAVVSALIYFLSGAVNWPDYALGAGISGGNIWLILWGIRQALAKKSFALTVLASVFKYGFLILLFWFAAHSGKKVETDFIIGILLTVPTSGFLAYKLMNLNGLNIKPE